MDAQPCHPGRRRYRGTQLCRPCWEEALCLEAMTDTITIARGAGQQFGAEQPEECPHCHTGPPAWRVGDGYSFCVVCGADFYNRRVIVAVRRTKGFSPRLYHHAVAKGIASAPVASPLPQAAQELTAPP